MMLQLPTWDPCQRKRRQESEEAPFDPQGTLLDFPRSSLSGTARAHFENAARPVVQALLPDTVPGNHCRYLELHREINNTFINA